MTNENFSWVVGQVRSVETFGDFAILDMGGAFAVVQVSTKDFLGCCPTFSKALRFLRTKWAA